MAVASAKMDKLFNKTITEVSCTNHHKKCCRNMDCIFAQRSLSLVIQDIAERDADIK